MATERVSEWGRDLKRARKNNHHQTINSSEDSKPLPYLSHEIILHILSRLPVKSLLRFRCVNKSWCSLISDPKFIKTHLNLSSKSQKLILGFLDSDPMSCSAHSLFYEPVFNAVHRDFLPNKSCDDFAVLGSCNGLLCVATKYDSIYIWNPSTREESKILPPCFYPCCCFTDAFGGFAPFGFGYDDSNEDYKIVFYDRRHVFVYSLRRYSWRSIQPWEDTIVEDHGKYINGVLHWKARATEFLFYPKTIVSFDLNKETYGVVEQPNYGEGSRGRSLGVLDGCLCVLTGKRECRADLWVMKEYGVPQSWTRLLTVSCAEKAGLFFSILRPNGSAITPLPLSVSENGDIVVEVGPDLVLYNHKDNTFKYSKVPRFHAIHELHTFCESLVSPNAYRKIERQHQWYM